MNMAKKKPEGEFATKLVGALEGKKIIKKKEPPKVVPVATDSTPPPDTLPALATLKGLKAGDLITVAYAMEPGRVPGVYGAEVVTVSQDGADASIKFLFPNKPPRSGALKVLTEWVKGGKDTKYRIIDAADERVVIVKRPNKEQRDALEGIRSSSAQRSPDKAALKVGEVAALVYPKVTGDGDWAPGVVLAQVQEIGKDGHFKVVTYNPDYLEEGEDHDYAVETVELIRSNSGEYTDSTYKCRLAMVRKPTPGELSDFEENRKAVVSRKAIPNAPKPAKQQQSLFPSAPTSAA